VVHRALAELEYLSFEADPAELASRMKAMAAAAMEDQASKAARDIATV
jgi:hypothetical protein